MPIARCRTVLAPAVLAFGIAEPPAARERPFFDPAPFAAACAGECRVTVLAGQFLDTNMTDAVLPFDSDFRLPWDWDFREDYMVALALSRRLATLGGAFDIEAEVGLAQRFGEEAVTEGWIALYGRWTEFPWNHVVRTSFAVSTGFNLASRVSEAERDRSAFGTGNELLHYFSPEITLADPDWERTEIVVRLHHRSGGGKVWGDIGLFDGVAEGAQYLSLGLRRRF